MDEKPVTVAESLRGRFEDLTRAERQLADVLLGNYPAAGLSSMTTLAETAGVSTPTVTRLVKKLGFDGFPEFQASLRNELAATTSTPISKHDSSVETAPETHILNRFAEAVTWNLNGTFARIDPDTFDTVAEILADPERRVAIIGGRITRAIADYFFTHLQVVRDDVRLVPSTSSGWPHYLLSMGRDDVLVVFDIRRYETELHQLAEIALERGIVIVLFTDQWGSPVAPYAKHVFNCRIQAPSAWDSSVATLFVVEALISAIENLRWESTRQRMQILEELFDRTGLLKKFV